MTALKVFNDKIIFCSAHQLIVYSVGVSTYRCIDIPTIERRPGQIVQTKNGQITCLSVSKGDKFMAVSTENKQVVIFDEHFDVIRKFIVPRILSQICFTPTNSIVVADKTGDVHLYSFDAEEMIPVLLLGHMSVILDVLVAGKYIITCDRDEKIRVSHFPNAYSIQSFCLGHTEFVISLRIAGSTLVSASGDGTVRFWDYNSGKQLGIINTNTYINEDLVSEFCEEMMSQEVQVSVLPITDMQTYFTSSDFIIAASLFNFNELLIFSVNKNTLGVNHHQRIKVESSFSFCLDKELIILTSSKIRLFEFNHQNFSEKCNSIIEFSNDHDMFFKNNQNINLLYKKKFDNVSEYIERKKARMEL